MSDYDEDEIKISKYKKQYERKRKSNSSSLTETANTIITESNSTYSNLNKNDILTKNAIDEIKTNIEIFKKDINNSVIELVKREENMDLASLKDNINVLETYLEKDLRKTREQNDKELLIIKNIFYNFRDKVFNLISKLVKKNEKKVSELYYEIRKFEKEVNKKFYNIEDKQEEYINVLKLILQTTNDRDTQTLVEQFLVDDPESYNKNKNFFLSVNHKKEEIDINKKKYEERKKVKEILNEEIKKLENEVNEKNNVDMQKKHLELLRNFDEEEKKAEIRENERLNKLNEIEEHLKKREKFNERQKQSKMDLINYRNSINSINDPNKLKDIIINYNDNNINNTNNDINNNNNNNTNNDINNNDNNIYNTNNKDNYSKSSRRSKK